VVDDHALFSQSLEIALTIEGYDAKVVPLPAPGLPAATIISQVLRLEPRLVVLDLDLGSSGSGAALVGPLAARGIDVVVLTAAIDRARWGEAIRQGARKVVSKSAPLRESLGVVRRLQQGLAVTTVQEREELIRHHHEQRLLQQELRRRVERLTAREAEVLGRLVRGRTVREIAAAWLVSEATVRTQVKAILAKLDVTSQIAAVAVARQVGTGAEHARNA
jgi:DNA-binding NarL/FixJ family response regulator